MYINRVRGDISILRECLEETMDTIDLDAIRNADVQYKPYEFLLARDLVRPEKGPALLEEFPEMTKPGYLTVDQDGLSGTFRRFIQELEGPELTEELSVAFDRDLAACPRLTTIMRYSGRKHGAIHTDGESKVLTLLVYLNPRWGTGAEGRLRVLYDGEDVDNFAVEVDPTMGSAFAFLRSDHSWHGHRPFVGERRVVQIAWLKDDTTLARKTRTNRIAQLLKSITQRQRTR